MAESYNLVLVTGSMRSGTTLLQEVLCCAPDANPFIHACRYLTAQIEVFARYAARDRLYIEEYLGGTQELFSFTRDILDRLLQETHRRVGEPRHLVLKNPGLAPVLLPAAALLPRARFVVSVREPKDTIASMIMVGEKHRQSGVASFLARSGRDITQLCGIYRQSYAPVLQALKEGDTELKERICLVSYESLIRDTDAAVARLAAFTGLPLAIEEVAVAGQWRRGENHDSGALMRHPHWSAYVTELSGGPMSATSIGRHSAVLSETEARSVDALCADLRDALIDFKD